MYKISDDYVSRISLGIPNDQAAESAIKAYYYTGMFKFIINPV